MKKMFYTNSLLNDGLLPFIQAVSLFVCMGEFSYMHVYWIYSFKMSSRCNILNFTSSVLSFN